MAEWIRRCGGLLPEITVVLTAVWVLSGTVLIAKGSTLAPVCSNVTDSTETCCLCTDTISCQENVTCPEGYRPYNDTSSVCREQGTSDTTPLPPGTTVTNGDDTTVGSDNSGQTTSSLCYRCNNNEYFNGTKCAECDQLCLRCNGSGSNNCDPCRLEYLGKCVEACPNDTVEVDNDGGNGVRCAPNTDEEDGEEFPIVIVGGAVGGGVVLIVIILVVVIVCWRRRKMVVTRGQSKQNRTAMSEIIEDRSAGDNKNKDTQKEPAKTPGRRNYENQPDPGVNFGRDIQIHGDNVLRYIPDPTNNKNKANSEVPKDDASEIYSNHPAILMQKALNDKTVSPEKVQEQLDKQEIEKLPLAPSLPVVAKTKGKETENRGSYYDMSQHKGPDKRPAKRKTNTQKSGVGKGAAIQQESDNQEQEVYQNVEVDDGESDKEDYENMSTLIRKQQNKEDEVESEQEDYENMNAWQRKQHNIEPDQLEELDGPQEDYENLAFDNSNEVIVGKVNRGREAVGQVQDMSDKNPDDGEDNLQEDYENTESFKKTIVMADKNGSDNSYENVEFKRK